MKRIIYILTFFIVTVITSNCSDNSTDPISKEEVSLQTDLNWSSLANTAWPMNHGNPQSNGRSPFLGPQIGNLNYKISYLGIKSSLVLGPNDEIFITSDKLPEHFSALNINGDVIWEKTAFGYNGTTPLISDSTLYFADFGGLNAFGLDGSEKWKYDIDCSISNIGINIGLDGTIYCVTIDHILKAISPTGILLWELKDERFKGDEDGGPTFSPDGETLYIQGDEVSVLAVNIENHSIKWIYGSIELQSSPVIDAQGNIYFIPGSYEIPTVKTLIALNAEGELIWKFDFEDHYISDNTEPTIDYDGNIYFGGSNLYSLNYKGSLRWKYNLENLNIISPLVSDIGGNVYIGSVDLKNLSDLRVTSISKDGKLNWEISVNDERLLGASPAITNNGKLIFPTFGAFNILIIN